MKLRNLLIGLSAILFPQMARGIVIIILPNPPKGYPKTAEAIVTGLNPEMDGLQTVFPAVNLNPLSLGYRHSYGDNYQESFNLFPVTPLDYSGPWEFNIVETNGPDETLDILKGTSGEFLWNGQTDVPWSFINDNMSWTATTDGVDYSSIVQPDNFSISAVPEPSLLLLSGVALGLLGRRKAQ